MKDKTEPTGTYLVRSIERNWRIKKNQKHSLCVESCWHGYWLDHVNTQWCLIAVHIEHLCVHNGTIETMNIDSHTHTHILINRLIKVYLCECGQYLTTSIYCRFAVLIFDWQARLAVIRRVTSSQSRSIESNWFKPSTLLVSIFFPLWFALFRTTHTHNWENGKRQKTLADNEVTSWLGIRERFMFQWHYWCPYGGQI